MPSKEGGLSGLCSLLSFVVSLQGPHQRSLLKNLLKDYNRMERPVANDSQPLTVVFTLSLIQIMDVVSLSAGMLPRFHPLQEATNPEAPAPRRRCDDKPAVRKPNSRFWLRSNTPRHSAPPPTLIYSVK